MSRKKILQQRDNIRLSIVYPVYKDKISYTKLPDGELMPEKKEVLKKEITMQKWFKRDAIVSVEEYITTQDKIAKKRSVVYDKYSGRSFVTYHSPDEIMNTIYPDVTAVTGFKIK